MPLHLLFSSISRRSMILYSSAVCCCWKPFSRVWMSFLRHIWILMKKIWIYACALALYQALLHNLHSSQQVQSAIFCAVGNELPPITTQICICGVMPSVSRLSGGHASTTSWHHMLTFQRTRQAIAQVPGPVLYPVWSCALSVPQLWCIGFMLLFAGQLLFCNHICSLKESDGAVSAAVYWLAYGLTLPLQLVFQDYFSFCSSYMSTYLCSA